jgi:molybdopterin biosynthesis enzyme
VKPFLPLRVGVVSKQRPDAKLRARFESVLQRKLDWFGSSLGLLRYTEAGVDAVTAGFREVREAGAELILTAGSASADPLDSLVVAIENLGGHIEVRGTPAHPGSFFWLAYLGDCPVFGMPSCGAYSESTVVDLLLLRAMAGLRLTRVDIAELGAGGLFGRGMGARFPAYEIADEEVAAAAPAASGNGVAIASS